MTAIEKSSELGSEPPGTTLVHIHDAREWEQLASAFRDYNYRQTWSYGLTSAERYRADIERVAVKLGSEVVGLAAVRLKSIPLLRTGMAYVGGGPLTRRDGVDDVASLEVCLKALREEYLVRRGHTLRILPPLHPAGGYDAVCACFQACGFGESPWPPPYRTLIVDVTRPLPVIRKALAQKWRNCLNNGERQNLTVRSGSEPELFDQFHDLFEQFMDRKQISVELTADFFREVRGKAESDDGYVLSLATLSDGTPVAGHLASMLGDTGVYLQGATGEIGLKNKAAYVLQWHAIVTAQQRGMKWYELGGIDPETMPGVYHFKLGMSGTGLASPGPFQAAPTGMLGSVTPAVERLYRWTMRRSRRG